MEPLRRGVPHQHRRPRRAGDQPRGHDPRSVNTKPNPIRDVINFHNQRTLLVLLIVVTFKIWIIKMFTKRFCICATSKLLTVKTRTLYFNISFCCSHLCQAFFGSESNHLRTYVSILLFSLVPEYLCGIHITVNGVDCAVCDKEKICTTMLNLNKCV